MNKLQAEKKARSLNSSVKNPNIEYRIEEVRPRYSEFSDEVVTFSGPMYRVVQSVKLRNGDTVNWITY